ncbi:unnamed protein product [marine sediment metagenome]|uniref:Uncharacterized protein n=1 Tax=marine sediment metagenome TaxID=412755 RepID=X0XI15_9ZZZZ
MSLENLHELSSLDEFVGVCHEQSVNGGWWDGFCSLNEEAQLNVLGTKIALIHSETSEMMEGLRKGKMDDHLPHRTQEEVEAADIFIRLADYCGRRNIQLPIIVIEKATYNADRADHKSAHRAAAGGKKF